jgi:hypothetical protein
MAGTPSMPGRQQSLAARRAEVELRIVSPDLPQVEIDDWRLEYGVDLQNETITVTAAEELR